MNSILVFFGIFLAPVFTLGCVLLHYDHTGLAIIAFIISFIRGLGD